MSKPELSPEEQEQYAGQQLDREHIRPADVWRGAELHPFTKGTRLLFFQVCEIIDVPIFRPLAFVFIHLKRGNDDPLKDRLTQSIELGDGKFSIMQLCWSPDLFRAAIVQFREQLEEQEGDKLDDLEKEALRIMLECLERDNATRIVAGDRTGLKPKAGTQKKMEPIPATSHGRSRSSQSIAAKTSMT